MLKAKAEAEADGTAAAAADSAAGRQGEGGDDMIEADSDAHPVSHSLDRPDPRDGDVDLDEDGAIVAAADTTVASSSAAPSSDAAAPKSLADRITRGSGRGIPPDATTHLSP